jgi:hypothetical protein
MRLAVFCDGFQPQKMGVTRQCGEPNYYSARNGPQPGISRLTHDFLNLGPEDLTQRREGAKVCDLNHKGTKATKNLYE